MVQFDDGRFVRSLFVVDDTHDPSFVYYVCKAPTVIIDLIRFIVLACLGYLSMNSMHRRRKAMRSEISASIQTA